MRSSRIFHTTRGMGASSKKYTHPPTWKKIPLPTRKNPPVRRLPLSCPTQHQIFISPASKPKLLIWYTSILKNSTGTELSLWIGIEGLGKGPNSQRNIQIRWYCLLDKFWKQFSWKKKLFWGLATPVFSCFCFSIRVFFHGHWRLTGQQGKEEDVYLNFACEMTITHF